MENIFIGLFFCNFNFDINIGNFTIGIIPNFVGYYFIMKGCRELAHRNSFFEKNIHLCQAMAIYSAVLYVISFFRIGAEISLFPVILNIAEIVINLWILYNIVEGVVEIERSKKVYLYSERLKTAWMIVAITKGLGNLFVFIPFLNVALIVASFFSSLWFIFCFYQTKVQFGSIES